MSGAPGLRVCCGQGRADGLCPPPAQLRAGIASCARRPPHSPLSPTLAPPPPRAPSLAAARLAAKRETLPCRLPARSRKCASRQKLPNRRYFYTADRLQSLNASSKIGLIYDNARRAQHTTTTIAIMIRARGGTFRATRSGLVVGSTRTRMPIATQPAMWMSMGCK
jgi:hypothetical protein